MQPVAKQGEWVCLGDADYEDFERLENYFSESGSITSLISAFEELPEVLKDNHRSKVLKGSLDLLGRQTVIVAKSPVDKNRRKWSRLISLFAPGEAAATLINLNKMIAAGLETTRPICVIERRQFKMVVDSWICYEFREGDVCGVSGLEDIAELLRNMHSAGFRHDDPTWNNFLRDPSGTLFTIDTKAKPCTGMYHATRDFIALRQANCIYDIDIEKLGNLDSSSVGYRTAILYAGYKSIRTKIKDKLKKNRPKNS